MTQERRATDNQCWDAALIMGLVYTFVYALTITAVVFIDVPISNEDVVKMLVGAMTVIQTTIVQYFFGNTKSSAQSVEKTGNLVRELAATAPPLKP